MSKEKEMLENKVELLEEDIECVHLYLDDQGIPRKDDDGIYSVVGRIRILEQKRIASQRPRGR